MDANDVKLAVSHFLDLVANGREGERENVKALVVALDMLAWMQHVAGETDAASRDRSQATAGTSAAESEYEKMRGLVAQQFPSFGYYSTPAHPADQNGEAELLAGDAGADLAHIACELYEIARLFHDQRDAEALRAFSEGYEKRWRPLLRKLQWYIERQRRADRTEDAS